MNTSPAETALSNAMTRWSLSSATLIAETATSWVYRVEQIGRSPAVLKQLKPGIGDDELRGGALMAWYGGRGAATIFDAADGIVFKEWLSGPSLGDAARAGRDDDATVAVAALIKDLHRQRDTDPPPLLPLRLRFRALFDMAPSHWPGKSRDLLARAVGIAHGLFDKPAPAVPLHGDLHHDNILSSARGWLAIDPKGLLGDPAYEVANVFRNPFPASKLVTEPARIARLVEVFAARLGYAPKRILAYAAAHSALSACWEVEAGKPIAWDLAVLPHLLAAYDRA